VALSGTPVVMRVHSEQVWVRRGYMFN